MNPPIHSAADSVIVSRLPCPLAFATSTSRGTLCASQGVLLLLPLSLVAAAMFACPITMRTTHLLLAIIGGFLWAALPCGGHITALPNTSSRQLDRLINGGIVRNPPADAGWPLLPSRSLKADDEGCPMARPTHHPQC